MGKEKDTGIEYKEEEELEQELIDSLTKFEELERDTKRIIKENKELREKNRKISEAWTKYFKKSMEMNSEIFMDFKQELNKILEIDDKKRMNQQILEREDREFRKIERAIKKIEDLEKDATYEDPEENEKYIYKGH